MERHVPQGFSCGTVLKLRGFGKFSNLKHGRPYENFSWGCPNQNSKITQKHICRMPQLSSLSSATNWKASLEPKLLYLESASDNTMPKLNTHACPNTKHQPSLKISACLWDSIFSIKNSPISKLKYVTPPHKIHLWAPFLEPAIHKKKRKKETSRLQSLHFCRLIFVDVILGISPPPKKKSYIMSLTKGTTFQFRKVLVFQWI